MDEILCALGTTYGNVMMELTTYPYWLRFHSERRHIISEDGTTPELPKLMQRSRRKAWRRTDFLRPALLKMCPVCLDEDFQYYGEPYLRRSHHLPFVRVCHRHGLDLATRCPKCEQLFRMSGTYMQARVICSCGYDLRSISSGKKSLNRGWGRLAVYSAEALSSRRNFEGYNDVYRFFDSRLDEMGLSNRPQLLDYLAGPYESKGAKAILTIAAQRTEGFTHALIGSTSKQEFRAPQICALLATVDKNFKETLSKLGEFMMPAETESNALSCQGEKRYRIPRSIDEARLLALQTQADVGEATTRSFIYRRYKYLFWYLTIFDSIWFESKYPHGRKGATANLPSIEMDRSSILQAILRAKDRSVRTWKNLAQQAFFRASIRDAEWLESRKEETARELKENSKQRKFYLRTIHIEDFKQAYKRAQAIKQDGNKVGIEDVAAFASLNVSQLKNLLYEVPELLEYLRN